MSDEQRELERKKSVLEGFLENGWVVTTIQDPKELDKTKDGLIYEMVLRIVSPQGFIYTGNSRRMIHDSERALQHTDKALRIVGLYEYLGQDRFFKIIGEYERNISKS